MLATCLRSCSTPRFRADDPDELVLASLACPLCLRTEEVLWEASFDGDYDRQSNARAHTATSAGGFT